MRHSATAFNKIPKSGGAGHIGQQGSMMEHGFSCLSPIEASVEAFKEKKKKAEKLFGRGLVQRKGRAAESPLCPPLKTSQTRLYKRQSRGLVDNSLYTEILVCWIKADINSF